MLPRPVYELLPYLYFSIGIAAATNVDPSFGRLSGLLMAMTGVYVWRLRRDYRKGWN
jgi:hypothetical protein